MTQNIERFLQRYSVSRLDTDLSLLKAIASAYKNLPYENVTKILKESGANGSMQRLRYTEELLEDHLLRRTGGTCFSLCNALQQILHHCAFEAFIGMADMHYGTNIHCAVVATTQGDKYLLDPGYLLHEPIPLPKVEVVRNTPMNQVILRNEGNDIYSLYTIESRQEKWRYRLRAQPVSTEEFDRHWDHSFSLNSMEHVTLSLVSDTGRLYYRKDKLELVRPQQRTSQKVSAGESQMLASMFGLPPDLIAQAQKLVNR